MDAVIVPTEAPGEPFRLLRELGRGGMGVVFLAEDHKRGDHCAVKLLHPHLTQDETMVARFQREARTASAIDHPVIVKIRGDIARAADGRWYCMMEYLDGQTLAQFYAQRGPLPLALVLEIIAPICDALNDTHAAGIIHRDLKPDNVIVLVRADGYVPKLLDFGIAKLIDEPGVTRPGAVPGTSAYMAPEQLRGDAVDRRCDIYALGVLVYQMITGGHLPYDAPHAALYHAQMTQAPIDPRRRCASVPAEAVGPILAAIHPDSAQRPTTAGTFALMLARILVGQTPQTDGMAILQRVAPRLLVTTNLHETLRAPGLRSARASGTWSYDYGAVLGTGGFGEVLRGVKHGAPGFALPVAIKRILREHAEKPEFVEMFHQEARVAALLGEHPNIVKVLDHLTDPSGQLAIVMEYIDGIDLAKLRDSGPIPHAVVIFIIGEVLEGLGHAHHLPVPSLGSSADEIAVRGQVQGVIHRDMSPHNVMISWYCAIKVMDFGIAKLRLATLAPGSIMLKGKPAYMSPEQANTGVELDGRSDLFAVGIILWELLTGRSLFGRDDYRESIAAILFAPIPRPSVSNPEVPPDLEQVVMRLLERDPNNRYQTARDAFVALTACTSASRNAKIELQQLLRARFPDSAAHAPLPQASTSSNERVAAGTAPDSPRAFGLASPSRPARRVLRVAAAMLIVGAAFTVSLVIGSARHAEVVTASSVPAAAPPAPAAAPPAPAAALAPAVAPPAPAVAPPAPAVARPAPAVAPPAPAVAPPAPAVAPPAPAVAPPAPAVAPAAAPPAPAVAPAAAPLAPAAAPPAPAAASPPAAPLAPAAAPPAPAAASPPAAAPPAPATRPSLTAAKPAELPLGKLDIIVKPWAMVSINGRPVGQTPIHRALPIGNYRIRLVNDIADKDETMTVTVSRGEATNIERTWARR